MKKFLYYFLLLMVSLPFCSCDDEVEEVVIDDQTMIVGSTFTIPDRSMDWVSDNELIASVSQGVVTAERVGTTIIHNATGTKSFIVKVKGMYDLYREPCVNWGASRGTVKSYMSAYSISMEYDTLLYYDGHFKEYLFCYVFSSSNELLFDYVLLKHTSVTTDQLLGYLQERYLVIGEYRDDEYIDYVFETLDGKTVIELPVREHYEDDYYVIYSPSNYISSLPAD